MEKIAKPNKINYQAGEQPNQGTITIEPFYPGYGMTLGNSLRRVLLSSLSGAAITGVKIKGANHEFTTLPHVKEDVLDIILNLKQLRIKILGDEEQTLELDVAGKKKITANDFNKNSQVEIMNPDLEIANITDVGGNLNLEVTVSQGRGYRSIEQSEIKNSEISFIEVDAVFSPVLAVGLNVENVRVGKMTNWNKLVLDITTDGTIDPKTAFDQAVEILIDQFQALVSDKKESKKKEVKTEDKKEDKKADKKKTDKEEKATKTEIKKKKDTGAKK